jgi:iron(III) transport system ATP-binding protein
VANGTPAIALRQVVKQFGPTRAVDRIDLTVASGELVALLGPSGCGKTTTLRLIAGLETPDQGEIWIAGRQVAGAGVWVPPEQRQIGLVFQDGALFPHLTVAENISFSLQRSDRAAKQARVSELLDLVAMSGLEARYPHQLSGGQQQRVALARALAARPVVVLLDEPFANLDAALRVELREEVAHIVRLAGATAVLVTHDQTEALSMADRVAVLFSGQAAQIATPHTLYTRPASRTVADFVGGANWLSGLAHGTQASCRLGEVDLMLPGDGPVDLLVRPEQLRLEARAQAEWAVRKLRYFGHDQLVELVAADGMVLSARTEPWPALTVGSPVQPLVSGPLMAYPVGR